MSAVTDSAARSAKSPFEDHVVRRLVEEEPPCLQWLCTQAPERVRGLFTHLDLSRPGLETARAAADLEDWTSACTALLAYYRDGDSGDWLRRALPESSQRHDPRADPILDDIIVFSLHSNRLTELTPAGDRVPRLTTGALTWDHRGPENDSEWAYNLNRHKHIAILLDAYRLTGNLVYARRIDRDLRDWLAAVPRYPAQHTNDPRWRGLEVAFRVKLWAQLFYQLQTADILAPITRILILAALPEHAHYARHFHANGGNWVTMELAGLAVLAAAWPEFSHAPAWLDYARQRLNTELTRQVYPDGVQMELSSSYHNVVTVQFDLLAQACQHAGKSLPAEFEDMLIRMWSYVAFSVRPDGRNPNNSDSSLIDQRECLREAAVKYGRPDWLHVATGGLEGPAPIEPPSRIFEWAGQLISRSDWTSAAQWSFFDIGPHGTGAHHHHDALHLSIYANGRDLLVDSGVFAYDGRIGAQFRHAYAWHSCGHNVVLIDDCGQGPLVDRASRPLSKSDVRIERDFDFARGACESFDGLKGRAVHSRALIYLRGNCWIVVDRIQTDRPRRIKALWHFHPRCGVEVRGNSVATCDPDVSNITVTPAGAQSWTVTLVKGQTTQVLQGWHSEHYGQYEAATCAEYEAELTGDATFAWLIMPGFNQPPSASLHIVSDSPENIVMRLETMYNVITQLNIPLVGHLSPRVTR